ncbi:Rap1a/Tai family immunity protein [Halopseudomonas aestusnigri]|uniref:Rap1a/Tai family immunity protein n=1 Tax=Halopseudomonas aestusnigri TaxID=857252 RepID=UPI000C926452|nr:hypothetical protein [Pseudomonadales bacterium]HBT55629.1 hypothetical protein [Pseudomonas sp.]
MATSIFRAITKIFLMAITGSAVADGNKLLDQCQTAVQIMDGQNNFNNIEAVKLGQCLGFAAGVKNTLMIMSVPSPVKICWPEEGVSNGQAARILHKYLKDNPQKLHEDETLLAMLSMSEAFACN